MRFKSGTKVEVCSNEPGFAGAWFEGIIVSYQGGGLYEVQYDKFETDEGHPLVEKTEHSTIRPRPPKINNVVWRVCDSIEVYDKDCWWKGVISKVLPNKYYSVYFPDYATESEYPESKIRSKQEWEGGKWSKPTSACMQAIKLDTLKRGHAFDKNTDKVDEGFPYEERHRVKKFKCSTMVRDIYETQTKIAIKAKGFLKLHAKGSFSDASRTNIDDKEYSLSTTGSHTAFSVEFQDKRANVVDKKESTQYSTKKVPIHEKNQKQREIVLADEHNLNTHKLELSAYSSVLQAFHAQGSLSWERETLLTNLRHELHISCQEHTFVLEQLAI